jgi:hypothetical protein
MFINVTPVPTYTTAWDLHQFFFVLKMKVYTWSHLHRCNYNSRKGTSTHQHTVQDGWVMDRKHIFIIFMSHHSYPWWLAMYYRINHSTCMYQPSNHQALLPTYVVITTYRPYLHTMILIPTIDKGWGIRRVSKTCYQGGTQLWFIQNLRSNSFPMSGGVLVGWCWVI